MTGVFTIKPKIKFLEDKSPTLIPNFKAYHILMISLSLSRVIFIIFILLLQGFFINLPSNNPLSHKDYKSMLIHAPLILSLKPRRPLIVQVLISTHLMIWLVNQSSLLLILPSQFRVHTKNLQYLRLFNQPASVQQTLKPIY